MKMLLTLALRNLTRHRARTATTWFAIVVGVTGLVLSGGFIKDILIQLGEAIVRSQTGHVQIARPAYFESGNRLSSELLLSNSVQLAAAVRARPHVAEVMGRLDFSGIINNSKRDYAVLIQGIEPEPEARLGNYLRVTQGRGLQSSERFGALVGEGLAQAIDLHPGDKIVLLATTPEGALNTIDFTISGIFQSFSKDFDARAVRITLPAAQELIATPGINVMVVRLDRTTSTAAAAADIRRQVGSATLSVMEWNRISDFYDKTVELYDRQFGVLQFIIFIMVVLTVANSVNMSSFERTAEFGTLRAMGTPSGQVARMLIAENVVLGLIGATSGVLIGIVLALVLSAIGIQMPPPPNANLGYVAQIRIVPQTVLIAWLIGAVATALAALLPARRAAHADICEALRHSI